MPASASRARRSIGGSGPPARHVRGRRGLAPSERQAVLDVLHSDRFVDQSPAEVHATLLEQQTYLCSPRTMYRVLAAAGEVRERRDQARHPAYAKPELVATAPNQIWSWDITKLRGPVAYLYFSLYVILDLFSRYVVGWMVAAHESARLAERLIEATCHTQGIAPKQLTIHADRGAPMRSKRVAELFADYWWVYSPDGKWTEWGAPLRGVWDRWRAGCQRSCKLPPAVIENVPHPVVEDMARRWPMAAVGVISASMDRPARGLDVNLLGLSKAPKQTTDRGAGRGRAGGHVQVAGQVSVMRISRLWERSGG